MTTKWIFYYLLYLIVAFIAFAFILFPREQVAKKMSNRLGQLFPGITLDMAGVAPVFPPGLRFEKPEINLKNRVFLSPDNLVVKIPFFDIFNPGKEVKFSGNLFDGVVKGIVKGVSLEDNNFAGVELSFEQIKARQILCSILNSDLNISFDLNGQYVFPDKKNKGKSSGKLFLTHVVVKIKNPVFASMGIDTLEFTSIELDFLQNKKKVSILKCVAKGNVMTVQLKGDLIPAKNMFDPLEDWSLELTGFVQPQPAYVSKFAGVSSMENLFKNNREQGIPIRIIGPLKAPGIEL
ncbi:MAG: type II secretion system protein GspN [Desulfobacteraceae bacterium]|nr:type II secretion system protein GspN [Desulfobacteraceae bacterium]